MGEKWKKYDNEREKQEMWYSWYRKKPKQVDKVQHKCINTLSVFHKMELLNYERGTYHLSTRFNLILGSFIEILDHKNQGLISKNRFWLIVRKLYTIWQTLSFWNRTRFWYKTGNMFDILFNSPNSERKMSCTLFVIKSCNNLVSINETWTSNDKLINSL